MTTGQQGEVREHVQLLGQKQRQVQRRQGGLAMAEAWKYYDAKPPYAGNSKVKTDYTGNVTAARLEAIYALAGNRDQFIRGLAVQQPGGRGRLRQKLHRLHQQRRRPGQQFGHQHGQHDAGGGRGGESITGATAMIPISRAGRRPIPRTNGRASCGAATSDHHVHRGLSTR
jgi:hypothetical protein